MYILANAVNGTSQTTLDGCVNNRYCERLKEGNTGIVRSKCKTRRKRWTADEVRYLRRNFGKKSITIIAQELGRTVSGVRAAVYALRPKRQNKMFGLRNRSG